MAVQVPRLNRFEPQQTQSVGRAEVSLPNIPAIVQPQMNAVMNIAEQQTAYFQKQEDNAIDTAAKAAANEYNIYLNNELSKARTFKGDPTKVYAQFDEMRETKFNEILNKNPDISSRGKAFIEQKLSQVSSDYQMKRDTAHAGQYYDYDLNVTRASSKLKSEDIANLAGFIDVNKPETFGPIDSLIRGVSATWNTHGEKFGSVTRDENGQWLASDPIKLEIGKDVSDGLVNAINVLNNSGRPELADAMFAKYNDYIDDYKKDTLKKNILDQSQTIKALNVLPKLVGKDDKQVEAILSKEFKDDPVGKSKAWSELSKRTNERENIQNNIAGKAYKSSFNIVSAKMGSSSPYRSEYEMMTDPTIKPELDKMTPSQLKSLKQLVVAPKDSNPINRNKAFTSFYNGEFKGMEQATFNEMLVGLNKQDRNRLEKLYQKYNSPLTTPEEIRQMNDLGSNLTKQLQAVGYVSKQQNFNSYSNREQIKITQAQNELMTELGNLPSNMSIADRNKYLQNFAARKKLQKDKEEANSGFFGSGDVAPLDAPPESTKTKTTSPFANVKVGTTEDKRRKAVANWFKDNPKSEIAPTTAQIEAYMDKE